MADTTPSATTITLSVSEVAASIEMSVGLTPEMVEDVLMRCRRQVVGTCTDLGLVVEAVPVVAEADEAP